MFTRPTIILLSWRAARLGLGTARLSTVALCALLTACAAVRSPGSAATPITGQAAAIGPSATNPTPFETVIKGAERQEGWLPIWKRQDKVWIELAPQDFGRALFLSPRLSTGLGEAGFFGGLLASRWGQFGKPQWVEFRKSNQQVQLVAVNASFMAAPDTPEAQAVQAAYSPSLLGSVSVASAPHPQRGTVLVELSNLLTGDVLGLGMQLQRAFRQNYSLDARNTTIAQVKSTASGLVIEVQQHYAASSLSMPTAGTTGPQPSIPVGIPDARSLFLTVQYTLSTLPTQAMTARTADARVGYFTSTVADFSQDLARTPRQRFINRWRLEKKDPQAALSAPVRPIVYWMDKSIPKAYRATITEGILAWNQAFEAIGFKDAIEVREGTGDLPHDVVGNGQAVVRWMTNNQPNFGAIGPTHVDPRTGEILTADIALESLSSRAIRAVRSQILSGPNELDAMQDPGRCEQADMAAEQLSYALDALGARDALSPDSPQTRDFVLAYIKETTMHEVGHTLGLRHNFRASRWRTQAQLAQLDLTTKEGKSASVMDYAPINFSLPGQPAGAPFQTTLGPYDFWAIEYGYKPLTGSATEQKSALQRIAARSEEPAWRDALDYGTDEDQASGPDPYSLTFDLGRDPIAFARQRLAIARDLMARQAKVKLDSGDEAAVLRRRVTYALRDVGRVSTVLTRQIGGLVSHRDGPESTRPQLDPLPASVQRAALTVLIEEVLSPKALGLPPALQRRLVPDYFDRSEGVLDANGAATEVDFSVADQIRRLNRAVLNALMSDEIAERLLDNIDKTRDRDHDPVTVRELHRRLREAIWPPKATLAARADDSAPWVRNLQRDYVNRLTGSVLRGSERADIRAQLRQQARDLVEQLQHASKGDPDSTEQAHRRDCLETLQRALAATVLRNTP